MSDQVGGPHPRGIPERVVVVGGGVIGTACAYYLMKAGCSVVILEKDAFGQACSHGNCGFVCPSHVLPLSVPGAVRQGLSGLLHRNSPLRIKPTLNPRLWAWFWRFARECRRDRALQTGCARQALLNSSMQLYREILAAEGLECQWQERGLLFVYQHEHEWEEYAETDRMLRDEFGLGATRYDADQLVKLEPALRPGLGGAWHYEGDTHLRADQLLSSWRRCLEQGGVEIHEECEVQRIDRRAAPNRSGPPQATQLVTSRGAFDADAFVFATGATTPLLERELECRIRIQPGKGYSLTMPRPAVCPQIPMIFEEHRVAVTPFTDGFRIGSTMEFAGYDDSINRRRLQYLKESAAQYLTEPTGEPIEEEWYGWRPMTHNGRPLIGPTPTTSNVYLAVGHGMLGLSMAPATGKLLSELICEERPHLDAAAYRVAD